MCLLAIQAGQAGFELPLWFSLLAYFTFGATGAMAAVRRGYDLVGVCFMALISSGGGGLLRDGLLLSSGPASILQDGRSLIAVFVGALLALLFRTWVQRLHRAIAVIDALGLGAFAVIGVERTLGAGLGYTAAWIGGTLTAVGGGVLRDVLVREEPLLFKPGQFYGMVAIAGCGIFIAQVKWKLVEPNDAALYTIVAVFVLRMLSIRFNWRTSAVQTGPEKPA